MINPYHVQVRKKLKKEETEEIEANDAKGEGDQDEENQRKTSEQQHYVKMSLQLYQVVGQASALQSFKGVLSISRALWHFVDASYICSSGI